MTPRLSWCTVAPLLDPSLNTLSAVVVYARWCPRAFRARVVEPAQSSAPIRPVPVAGIAERLRTELDAFQERLFARAQQFQRENTFELSTLGEVVAHFRERAGFVWAAWCGDAE